VENANLVPRTSTACAHEADHESGAYRYLEPRDTNFAVHVVPLEIAVTLSGAIAEIAPLRAAQAVSWMGCESCQ
jgi:hypothetical protein